MLRILFTTVVLAAACAGRAHVATQDAPPDLAAVSAGLLGCPADAIQIGDVSWRAGDRTPAEWIASCGGKTFYCSTRGAPSCILVPGP